MCVKLGADIEGGTQAVFENRVLRRIFGPRREEVIGEWRKQHNKELNEIGGAYTGFWWGSLRERDQAVDGRIILRWIFRKWDLGLWTGLSWLRIGTSGMHL